MLRKAPDGPRPFVQVFLGLTPMAKELTAMVCFGLFLKNSAFSKESEETRKTFLWLTGNEKRF